MDPAGTWRLSPADDLAFPAGLGSEHYLSVAREGRAPAPISSSVATPMGSCPHGQRVLAGRLPRSSSGLTRSGALLARRSRSDATERYRRARRACAARVDRGKCPVLARCGPKPRVVFQAPFAGRRLSTSGWEADIALFKR